MVEGSMESLGSRLPEIQAAVYQGLLGRRAAYDSLMWQVPSLSLTAQAFLFTVMLAPDTQPAGRLTAALLSCIAAVMSVQLMAKHRHHEVIDSILLERYERAAGLPPLHARSLERARSAGRTPGWLASWSSYVVWIAGLVSFGVTAMVIAFVTVAMLLVSK